MVFESDVADLEELSTRSEGRVMGLIPGPGKVPVDCRNLSHVQ